MVSSWHEFYPTTTGMRVRPVMGEMLFQRHWLGTEVICHESTHAALGWFRRLGLSPVQEGMSGPRPYAVSDREERFCYGHGQIARQIVNHCHARGLVQ